MVDFLTGARPSALYVVDVCLVDGSVVDDLWCCRTVVDAFTHVELLRVSEEV